MSTRARQVLLVVALAALAFGCDVGAGRIDAACTSNADCLPTELCGTGLCEGGLGRCLERPTTCDDTVTSLVCGCDRRTYQTECFASLAGVRLAKTGPCDCEDNTQCVDGQFCARDDSCLNLGECLPRPESCETAALDPVCGCDGNSYDNQCSAFVAGVRVSSPGMCDCATNDDCSADQLCKATTCDGPGVCEARSAECPPAGARVIGCDGVEYESACDAGLAGERIRP